MSPALPRRLPLWPLLTLLAGLGLGYTLGQGSGSAPAAAGASSAGNGGRTLLYYRNPMGLPDTSPVPKKDPMGMDYLPVYADEAGAAAADSSSVTLTPGKVQQLGVVSETAAMRVLDSGFSASGRVEIDERRIHTVTAKFSGYIEQLHVATSGQPVTRGQSLFEVYSPELVSAQREYQLASQGVSKLAGAGEEARQAMARLAESSLQRLQNWDIPPEQVKQLAQGGELRRTLSLRAPVSGVVLDKKVVAGQRFQAGDVLFQLADTRRIWVLADVFEQDLAQLRQDQPVDVRINAYPGERFAGRIAYLYPTLNADTRTIAVRIELDNPAGRLKPGMYASVQFAPAQARPVLTVPTSAVIDSGQRQVVIVRRDAGHFAPRPVEVGRRGGEYLEILRGLAAGDEVVVSAHFLLDAESNLKAALQQLAPPESANAAPQAGKPASATVAHHGEGKLNGSDAAAGSVSISHA
ncbi:MAG: hypothetical protein RIR00_1827, partial [Pseudomonadota bacterium]